MRSKCLGALSAVLSITALLPLSCASYLSFAPEVGQSGLRIIEMRRIALLLCVILLPLLRKKLLPFFVRRLEGVVSRSRRPAVWQYAPLALETILVCALIAAYRTITGRTARTCFILLFVVLTIFSYIWISAVHHIRKKDEE